MKNKYIVIHFVHTLYGGVASVVASIINEQIKNGIIPIVAYVNDDSAFETMLVKKIKKIKVINKKIPGYSMLFGMQIRKIYNEIKAIYPKSKIIVHAHNVQTIGVLSDLKEINVLCTLHSLRGTEKSIRSFISDILYRVILRKVIKNKGKLTSVSKAIAQFYGKNKVNIVVIYNGIESEYIRRKQEKFTILHLGNISKAKGWDLLCEAFSQIPYAIRKNMTFIFAGKLSGEYSREKIDAILEEKGIKNESKYLGFINNAGKVLVPNADILVLASRNEGLGYVLIEALSQGIPILGAKTGGIVEVVEDKYNGYLIEDIEDIKNKIIELYVNNNLYKKISKNAFETYNRKFTSKLMYKKYLKLYQELDEKSNGGS